MFGVQALLDKHWEEDPHDDTRRRSPFWGHRLIQEWPDLLYFSEADKELPKERDGSKVETPLAQESGEQPGQAQGQYGEVEGGNGNEAVKQMFDSMNLNSVRVERRLRRYMLQIVIPLGSLSLGEYVTAPRRYADSILTIEDCRDNTLLHKEFGSSVKLSFEEYANSISQTTRRRNKPVQRLAIDHRGGPAYLERRHSRWLSGESRFIRKGGFPRPRCFAGKHNKLQMDHQRH